MELIQDIFFNSNFPEKEREKESEVVLSEIQSYEDSPSELIFDRAEEMLFPNQPIGRNILGSAESLGSFRNGTLERFYRENYATEEIVLSFSGDIDFKQIIRGAEKYFSDFAFKPRLRQRMRPEASAALKSREQRNTYQKHCMLVGEAYPLRDTRRLRLYLLNNILGGPGMNSRLNLALRERRGFSYSAESHYAPYTDTGAIMIYFSCDHERFQQCLSITRQEIRKLRTRPITESRLNHARRQLIGQLAIAYESQEHLMLTTGKRMLVFNQVDSLGTIRQKLEEITAKQLLETADELLSPERLNTLIFE
jgi:predicted Zn-dependent peptidase